MRSHEHLTLGAGVLVALTTLAVTGWSWLSPSSRDELAPTPPRAAPAVALAAVAPPPTAKKPARRRALPARVRVEASVADDAMSRAAVEDAVYRQTSRLEICHARAGAPLEAVVVLRAWVLVGPRGDVLDVTLPDARVGSEALRACVQDVLRSLRGLVTDGGRARAVVTVELSPR